MDDFAAFSRLIDALRPWLPQLVIVGGWAHRLHRFHSMARSPVYAALRTKDADLAFSPSDSFDGDIAASLKKAGFEQVASIDSEPPITQYHLHEGGGFYAEFLVPLHGSGVKRGGKPDFTMGTAGITAQKLRYLGLLLEKPWVVRLDEKVGVPVRPTEVLIPNPVSFIAQKILIRKYRIRDKRAQDALYIHDTLELFGGSLHAMKALWRGELRTTLPDKTARSVERMYREQFGAVDDVIREAVRLPQGRTLQPERFQATCLYGLDEIFGRTRVRSSA